MEDYLEFESESKFTVAAFNKVYLSVFGEKKTAKKYLSDMIEKDDRLSRDKNTVYGASILSVREVNLNRRVAELENQVRMLKEMLNNADPVMITAAENANTEEMIVVENLIEEMIVMVESTNIDFDAILEESAEELTAELSTEKEIRLVVELMLKEVMDEMETEIEAERITEMRLECERAEATGPLFGDDNIEEWLADAPASFDMIRNKIANKEAEIENYGLGSFISKLWNIFYLVFRNYNACESIDIFVLIGNTVLTCNKNKLNFLEKDDYEAAVVAISEEAVELLDPSVTSKDYKHLIELQQASSEIGMMLAEDRLSRRVQNVRQMEEEEKVVIETSKAKRKEALKKEEEEEEKKWTLFREKYLIGNKVEICEFNPSAPVRNITGNEVTVKFGDNNTYSYDGKKYKKIGGLYLEVDENGSTGKAEYYLKKEYNKITVQTYQADISLDITNNWAIAQDRKNFISYDIIDWLDYYTYDEMYDFTKNMYWLNKKQWDLEESN